MGGPARRTEARGETSLRMNTPLITPFLCYHSSVHSTRISIALRAGG
jgi:hypothetical protein